ncbi:uroporphyrinogen-III synthase [Salinispirillum sp. LH 10-3-1]|uniref:Uroporphyrinogen-III synthase n=1 Tax=Salinispirillum sp. LH 10-3-1 TaxID=2952525 RepID=A0AB38YH25_9GAMM
MKRTVILTKPSAQQARWIEALKDQGYVVESIPLIHIEPLPETAAQRSVWLDFDQFHGVVVVSPAAADIVLDRLDAYWPQPPIGIRWLCNGSGTAQVLLPLLGSAVHYPQLGNRAEDVLALPETQDVQDQRWLIVAGEGGREVTQPALEARGARVTRLEVYRRTGIELGPETQQRLTQPNAIVQISSLAALDCLTSQASMVTKQTTPLLISSPRLDSAAREHGWQHIVNAQGASLEAALDALNSLQEPTS